MKLPLGVLDLSPIPSGSTGAQALQNTFDLARLADRLGYTRYWLAEHHNMASIASSSPEIMIGQVARETSRIRVGSGGIMLPNHAALKVAESFHTLEALFPGRIDLGIGRAPGTDPVTASALRGSNYSTGAEEFPNQLADLVGFSTGQFPVDHPFRGVTAIPSDIQLPPIYLLGSSDYSAQLAAHLGLGFAFAAHFSTHDAVDAMRTYRNRFRPSVHLSAPRSILTVSVICAESAERADYLAATVDLLWVLISKGQRGPLPHPDEALAYRYSYAERAFARARRALHIIGDPGQVHDRIVDLADQTTADEVMVATTIHSHTERLRSFELVAEAFGLTSSG